MTAVPFPAGTENFSLLFLQGLWFKSRLERVLTAQHHSTTTVIAMISRGRGAQIINRTKFASLFRFFRVSVSSKSCDISVGIALGYGLDDWSSRVRSPTGAGNFSLHHRDQNSSGAHPVFYPVGNRDSPWG
jgi:hypothetical protein